MDKVFCITSIKMNCHFRQFSVVYAHVVTDIFKTKSRLMKVSKVLRCDSMTKMILHPGYIMGEK